MSLFEAPIAISHTNSKEVVNPDFTTLAEFENKGGFVDVYYTDPKFGFKIKITVMQSILQNVLKGQMNNCVATPEYDACSKKIHPDSWRTETGALNNYQRQWKEFEEEREYEQEYRYLKLKQPNCIITDKSKHRDSAYQKNKFPTHLMSNGTHSKLCQRIINRDIVFLDGIRIIDKFHKLRIKYPNGQINTLSVTQSNTVCQLLSDNDLFR